MKNRFDRNGAFSLVELLVIIAIIAIFVGSIGPSFLPYRSRGLASRIACARNLKQVGLCYRSFAVDHEDKFPMEISTNKGGSLEFQKGSETFRHFLAISGEIGVPKILACPVDTRKPATDYSNFSNENLSYFITLNASTNNPNLWLAGDRNLSRNDKALASGIYDISTNQQIGWTEKIHKNAGNILFADGSVQQSSPTNLNEQLRKSGEINRISIP